MFNTTNSLVVILVLLLSGCSTSYNSFTGTHQDRPFEAQVNAGKDYVWANIQEVFSDEKLPIFWKDKSSGIIVTAPVSFLRSYTHESSHGKLLDPSSRVVVSGDHTTTPNQIDGSWRFHVQSIAGDLSVITIELQYPKAASVEDGVRKNLFVRSTGAFEKMVYAKLMGKDTKESEKPASKPLRSDNKEEVIAQKTEPKEEVMEQTTGQKEEAIAQSTDQKILTPVETKPMAKEDLSDASTEIKKSENTAPEPAKVAISTLDDKTDLSQKPSSVATNQEPSAITESISTLKNQLARHEELISDQQRELEELRNQLKSIPAAKPQNSTSITSEQDQKYRGEGLTVQFIALTESSRQFYDMRDLGELVIEKVPNKNVYRYKIGHFDNKLAANQALVQIRKRGFSDAFID